jgi:hypothetical protein
MVLVFVDPTLTLLCLDHELVVAKAGVDKRVDKRARQVLPRRVDLSRRTARVLEVTLVNVFEALGFRHRQLLTEPLERFRQFRVVQDLGQRLVVGRDVDLLAGEDVRELALHVRVRRRLKVLLDECRILQAEREGERLGVALVALVDLVRGPEKVEVVGRREVVDHRDHVEADALVRVGVDIVDDLGDRLEFEEEVDGVRLGVVGEQERDEAQAERDELVDRPLLLPVLRVLFPKLGCQMSAVRGRARMSTSCARLFWAVLPAELARRLTARIRDPRDRGPRHFHP